MSISSTKPSILLADNDPRLPSNGKRKMSLLPFDPTGLRTTRTVTWAALDKVLAKNAAADHLVASEWQTASGIAEMEANAAAKGLPAPVGRRQKLQMSDNYNTVRW